MYLSWKTPENIFVVAGNEIFPKKYSNFSSYFFVFPNELSKVFDSNYSTLVEFPFQRNFHHLFPNNPVVFHLFYRLISLIFCLLFSSGIFCLLLFSSKLFWYLLRINQSLLNCSKNILHPSKLFTRRNTFATWHIRGMNKQFQK